MFVFRLSSLVSLLTLLMFACQPPLPPVPEISAVKIQADKNSLSAGSSLMLQAIVEGNDLALETGVIWSMEPAIGTLSTTSGKSIIYLAPSRLTQVASLTITATSALNPNKFALLEVSLLPVVSSIRLEADTLNLRSSQSTNIMAIVEGSGNSNLEWEVVSGGGSIQAITPTKILFVAPAVRQTGTCELRVTSRLNPSLSVNISLIVRPVVHTVASSRSFTLAIRQNGSLWGWGSNLPSSASLPSANSLGVRMLESTTHPTAFSNVKSVSAGAFHALILSETGSVWGFGLNDDWQLGTSNSSQILQKLPLENIVQTASGDAHSLALDAEGVVWAWGRNSEGQLGGGVATKKLPSAVNGLGKVVQVAAGQYFSLVLLEDGSVWGWGENTHGQLGSFGLGQILRQPQQVLGLSNIYHIAAGLDFALAVNTQGLVLAWGNNATGQLGDGTTTSRVSPIQLALEQVGWVQAGLEHSLALGRNGAVFSWGNNQLGQLGNDGNTQQTTPIRLALSASLILASQFQSASLNSSGELHLWGQNRLGQIKLPVSPFVAIPHMVFEGLKSP
jgi:alpha-tubulin suppressor-like RCC1 family protein